MNHKGSNVYFLLYADFVNNPAHKLREVIRFINPAKPVDMPLIHQIVDHCNIGFKDSDAIEKFKYYDPLHFKKLEQACYEELCKLNIKPRFQRSRPSVLDKVLMQSVGWGIYSGAKIKHYLKRVIGAGN